MARKLFCQYGPLCYWLSLKKEYLLRDIHQLCSGNTYAKQLQPEQPLPCVIKGHLSPLIRRLHGIDMQLQKNKVHNLRLAAAKINGIVIQPGECFSFWKLVGPTTAKRGYLEGLTISGTALTSGVGGGLCQLANLIHWLVLNSPLEVIELHHHSDTLFPDEQRRVPFGTGTSVFYKNVDYQFKNTTDQPVQLLLWLTDTDLCGELRSTKPFPLKYRIVEENHHFQQEPDGYYRISQIYRLAIDPDTRQVRNKELVLNNHSKVMYDPALIPPEQIRNEAISCS
ncbi:MAG: VanW family protein [Negativibacillus sp.]